MPVLTKKLTAEEFLDLDFPEDGKRYELHNGEVVELNCGESTEKNAPIPAHIQIQTQLNQLFGFYELRHPEFHSVIVPGIKIEKDQVRIPDLAVLLSPQHGGRCQRLKKVYSGPPHIVVEVLSSNAVDDLVTKRAVYEAADIPEYWIFDPSNLEAIFLRLNNGHYRLEAQLRGGRYETPHLPGFVLDVEALFREDLAALVAALG